MYTYLVLGAMLIGVSIMAVLTAAGQRRFRTAERLSTIPEYGFMHEEETRAFLAPEADRSPISAAATWLGGLLSKRLGAVGEEEIHEHLMAAGMYTTSPRTLLGYRIVLTILLPSLTFALVGVHKPLDVLVIGLTLFAGWVLPFTAVKRKARLRLDEIDRRLPDLIDMLCVMIEAGLSFPSAVRVASEQFVGPLSDELRLTLQEQTMGLGIDEALANLGERANTPAVRAFVRAMSQGERMGISIGQIMRTLAYEMRARRRSRAEERAQKSPVLMLFPLVFLIFPAMLLILMTPAVINLMHNFKGV